MVHRIKNPIELRTYLAVTKMMKSFQYSNDLHRTYDATITVKVASVSFTVAHSANYINNMQWSKTVSFCDTINEVVSALE